MAETVLKSSGIVVPRPLSRQSRVMAVLITLLIRTLSATLRLRSHDSFAQYQAILETPVIFCIWHNRLALCLILYRRFVARFHPDRQLAAMVSASRDGGLLARVLELFGAQPVRGSTSRRGPQALLELVTWGTRGYDLAITPDGPRGPRYVVQEGIIALAQLTALPIVPVAYHLNWKIQLHSWDRFQVPLPGSKCEWRLGPMIRVPRQINDSEREMLRQQLEQAMLRITRD
jgi:lysophospholipid acyltransferase (LPLAT)-like uncharacterized protein